MKLDQQFYLQKDVVSVSEQLIGKVLCSNINGVYTTGIISETEAYNGEIDKASHAYGGRRTKRTEVMYAKGGVSYVYLCYGIHYLFNVVINHLDFPDAVLIRGIKPLNGIDIILERRNAKKIAKNSCIGPGNVSQALGINKEHNNLNLCGTEIWIEDRGININKEKIKKGERVGVEYAEEDALLPYRFQYDCDLL